MIDTTNTDGIMDTLLIRIQKRTNDVYYSDRQAVAPSIKYRYMCNIDRNYIHEILETFKRDLITLNQPNTIVLICLYVPVFLTAIIGNLTVLIVIIPNRRMWSVTNNFL
jgi:hypothetical protein